MDRYIGLDAHASSCTVAVLGPSGRKLQCQVLETNAKALINFLETIPKNRRLIFEEGTHSNWLHEVLAPHVQETVVVAVRQSRGPKDDERDAFGLAEDLRIGNVKTKVYKKQGEPFDKCPSSGGIDNPELVKIERAHQGLKIRQAESAP